MKCKIALCAALMAFLPLNAHAGDSLITLGGGYSGVFDDDDGAGDLRLEYQVGDPMFLGSKPFIGLEGTFDGSLYTYGGLNWDWAVSPHWYLTPGLAAGLYSHGGGQDLGSALEFRSQIEAAYEFSSADRLGIAISHTENFGIGDDNPGTEALTVQYHMPLSRLNGGN